MVDPVLPLIAIGAAGLTPSAAILALRDRDAKRWSGELVPYRLEVSSSFDPAGLQQFLSALTGLLPSKWERPVSIRGIGVEAIATPAGIAHYLLVPQSQTDIVLGQLRASVPGARVTKERRLPSSRTDLGRGVGDGPAQLSTTGRVSGDGGDRNPGQSPAARR